jgi:3D (Asp-Asp-Asp) domain-containing protein/peptidoglycan hydrolase CwlO-like protein
VLQLYALNTSLDRARGRLAALDSELAAARRERDTASRQLHAAQRTLAIAQASLGAQLRALYERDNPDVLSVLVGASSLDEVITGLDDADRTAASTSDVIGETRVARARVARGLASLSRRASRLARLRSLAASQAAEIQNALAARSAYIEKLRANERLTSQRIAQLQSQARAAEAASTVATVQAQAVKSLRAPVGSPAPPPPPAPGAAPASPAPIQPASGSGKQLTVVATAYSLHGGTASGLPTGPGVVAVDPTVIPLGTRLYIPGYGPGIAADTGTAIKGLRIDLWFPLLSQAEHWGRRTVTITVR